MKMSLQNQNMACGRTWNLSCLQTNVDEVNNLVKVLLVWLFYSKLCKAFASDVNYVCELISEISPNFSCTYEWCHKYPPNKEVVRCLDHWQLTLTVLFFYHIIWIQMCIFLIVIGRLRTHLLQCAFRVVQISESSQSSS